MKGNFSRPAGITVDAEGRLYVADSGRSVVYILDSDGSLLESVGRFGWREGEFDSPSDVALDLQLRLYITDSRNNRLQRLSLIDRDFSIIVGKSTGETATELSLYEPQGVTTDARGFIYIADTWNHRILKVDPLGRVQMEIGGIGQLSNPQSVAVDYHGNVFVSDSGNNKIHKLSFSGSWLTAWGEKGNSAGQFIRPAGISLDKFGNIYVVDQGNHRVQIFDPDGSFLFEFGTLYLDEPVDITIDKGMRAYVTDMSAGDIEVFKIILSNE